MSKPDDLPDMIAEAERQRKEAWREAGTLLLALTASEAERDRLAAELAAAKAIIATHDLCHDLHGKAGRDEFEEGCRRETVKEFGSCGWAERIATLEAELAAAKATVAEIHAAVARELQPNSGIHLPGEGEQLARRVLEIIERGA